MKHLCACVKKNVHSLKCGTDSNSVATSYKHHSILTGALLWDCVLIWDIWWQGQGKICVGLSFNISDGIFTHWGICCFTTIQLYTTGCFFLLTMSLFLFKCEKMNYNTNVLKLACFCTLMRICASEQLTQIPMSHCSYELVRQSSIRSCLGWLVHLTWLWSASTDGVWLYGIISVWMDIAKVRDADCTWKLMCCNCGQNDTLNWSLKTSFIWLCS